MCQRRGNMELYHFSDGQYEKLTPQYGQNRTSEEDLRLRNKKCIWLTNDKTEVNGKTFLYRYTVDLEKEDINLIEDQTVTNGVKGSPIEALRWYGYIKELNFSSLTINQKHFLFEIYQYAVSFRAAIKKLTEKEIKNASSDWFNGFPVGCCGDASDLLAKYLLSKNIKTTYRHGWFEDKSHGWLAYNDYIIDITADQFEEISAPVIITKDNIWHSKFKNDQLEENIFKDFDLNDAGRLEDLYVRVIEKISTDELQYNE